MWQLRHSCGSLIFRSLIVEKAGFSEFAGEMKVIELATFLPLGAPCAA